MAREWTTADVVRTLEAALRLPDPPVVRRVHDRAESLALLMGGANGHHGMGGSRQSGESEGNQSGAAETQDGTSTC